MFNVVIRDVQINSNSHTVLSRMLNAVATLADKVAEGVYLLCDTDMSILSVYDKWEHFHVKTGTEISYHCLW